MRTSIFRVLVFMVIFAGLTCLSSVVFGDSLVVPGVTTGNGWLDALLGFFGGAWGLASTILNVLLGIAGAVGIGKGIAYAGKAKNILEAVLKTLTDALSAIADGKLSSEEIRQIVADALAIYNEFKSNPTPTNPVVADKVSKLGSKAGRFAMRKSGSAGR